MVGSRFTSRRRVVGNKPTENQQRSSKTFHTVVALSLSAVAWYNIYSAGPADSLLGNRRRRIQNGNSRRKTLFARQHHQEGGHRRASAASSMERGTPAKTETPIFLELCRKLVSDEPLGEDAVMIEETEETCTSPFWHSSLVEMFTSHWIAETARANDIKLQYRHDCPRFFSKTPQEESTIQMALPSPLIPSSDESKGNLDEVKAACGRCLQSFQPNQPHPRPEQCFFETPQHFARMVPTIRTNLRMAVGAVDDFLSTLMMIPGMPGSTSTPAAEDKEEEADTLAESMEETPPESPSEEEADDSGRRRLTVRSSSSSSSTSMWNRLFGNANSGRKLLATENSDAPSHDGEDNAVVYLDLDHQGQLHAIPHHVLASHLPRTITNLYVILSPACRRTRFRPVCVSYAREVQAYLVGLLPRAEVAFDPEESVFSTREIVSDFIHAESILCTAGSLGCILPAVSRRRVGADGQALDTVVVQNDELYPWLMMLPTQYTSHMTILPPTSSAPVQIQPEAEKASGDEKKKDEGDDNVLHEVSKSFLVQSPTDRSVCPSVRGRKGQWVQDWDFAPQLQYKTPLQHYLGFADRAFSPKPNLPYRRPTSYKWVEDESAASCDIDITSLASFCQTMKAHGLERIFYLGDYTQMNMAYSLWKVLGHEDNPVDREQTDPNFDREVQCEDGTTLTLSFARNDKMEENDDEVDMETSKKNCGSTYCYKWTDRYTSFAGPTLLVANFGSHFYSEDDFDEAMTRFTKSLEEMHRPRDAVFFRTNSPGHLDCQRGRVKGPFDNFEQYRPTVTWKYSWDLYDGYNDMAIRKSREYNERVGDTAATLQVVDVYPMTVLRQDGHMSGQDCQDCGIANDCINYALPGPTDWWNHLLFSNLQDMAPAATTATTNPDGN